MKKLALLAIVLMPALAIFGQPTKGNFVLSGAAGLNFKSSVEKTTYYMMDVKDDLNLFPILPTVGYFIADNLAVGFLGGIYFEKKEQFGDHNCVFVMPTFLHYLSSGAKVRPFIHAGLGYSWVRETWNDGLEGGDDKYRGLAGNFGGGLSYFITEKISLDLGLQYTRLSLKHREISARKYRQGEFGSKIGFSVFF